MENKNKVEPVRWGVLGAARIATAVTIPGMVASPWCCPFAIGARDLERAQKLAARFGMERAYGSYDQVLDDPDVEAVYIALPNDLHIEWALKAVAKGKHVLCEKPIALTARQACALLEAGPRLCIAEAFMVRQQPRWQALRQILRAGTYGPPLTVQMLLSFFMNNPDDFRHRPEHGGGALYDLGCYTAMTARYVFEENPRRVMAVAERNASGVDDTTTAILDFGGARHATFTVSTAMASSQMLHVVCERGFIDVPKPYVPASGMGSCLLIDTSAQHDRSLVTRLDFDALDQYEKEVTDFSRAVRGEDVCFFGIGDAVQNMRVMDAIFASAQSGRWEPVAL